MAVRLYKHLQDTLETENQYQALLETSGVFVALLSNDLSKMDYYTPTDTDYSCRQRILTKIMAKYYNYNLFTDLTEYFGNRLLWRLNQIMPTYKAKFNAMLSQSGYEDLWDDGVMTESRSGHRYTDIDPTDSYDKTILNDTTTSIDYQSDYPQVITGSAEVTVSGQTYTVNTDFNELGNKNKTTRGGDDKVEHSLDEDVNYGEDLTRKFTPEEIAKAKLLFARLIFNIDEEIVRAVADLFILVDCPFEEDFDVGARMSMLADAKAYTNLKFAESIAYTDTQIGNLPKIVIFYNSSTPTLDDVNNYLSHEDLMLYSDGSKDFFLSDKTSYTMTFGCIVGTKRYSITYTFSTQTWSSVTTTELKDMYYLGSFTYNSPPSLTVSGLQSILSDNQYPYWRCNGSSNGAPVFLYVNNDTYDERYIFQGFERDGSIRRFYLSYRNGSYDTWSNELIQYQTTSNLVTSWGSPTSDSKYPSEKLVKDTIDASAKLVEVTYDSTAYTTMMSYVGSDKIPYFIRTVDGQPFVYIYQGNTGGDVMVFTCNFHNGIYYQQKHITVTYNSGGSDTWDEYSQDLQERLVTFGADQNIKAIDSASVAQGSILGTGTLDLRDLVPIYYDGNDDPTNTKYNDITAIINNGQIPYINYSGYIYLMTYSTGSSYVFTTVVSTTGIRRITVTNADVWTSGSVSIQLTSNLVTSWGSPTSDSKYPSEKLVKDTIDNMNVFYDADDVTWNDIVSAKNNNKSIYLYDVLLGGGYLYYYLDMYTPNTNNDGIARFVQIGGNRYLTVDYQDNQTTGETLDQQDLFYCTYGTTTYTEVTQALSDGKLPYCYRNGRYYILSYVDASNVYFQSFINGSGAVAKIKVTNTNVWSELTTNLQVNNLVTSWQATPDNTHYPSEKLVKDSIDAIPKIYICTQGVTTYAQITQALNDGYIPIVKTSSDKYALYVGILSSRHIFSSINSSTQIVLYRVDSSNTWSAPSYNLQQTSNLVTSISSSSTDAQYPSAKCVYDAIQGIIAGQTTATFLIDLSQQSYSSGMWTISGVDLTPYSSFTILPYEKENPNWTAFLADNMYIDSSSITASGFSMYSGNSFQGKLRLVAYI